MGAHAGAQADCYAEMHNIIIIIIVIIHVFSTLSSLITKVPLIQGNRVAHWLAQNHRHAWTADLFKAIEIEFQIQLKLKLKIFTKSTWVTSIQVSKALHREAWS